MSKSFKGRDVVVIGGCGFVGSHLCDALVMAGASVRVIDTMERGRNVTPNVPILRVDASEPNNLVSHLRGADYVFNLAATVAGVIYNQYNHGKMFWENMKLQAAPAIAMSHAGKYGRLVQVSSVCVYSERGQSWARENTGLDAEPVGANNGYAWSKRLGERVPDWSRVEHVIVRPTNIYGPRDYFDSRAHVIPALIRKTFEDEWVELWGDGTQVREFIYVSDVVNGMMAAALRGESGEAYNLSTNGRETISMIELAEMIQSITGIFKEIEVTPENDGGDQVRRVCSDKARLELGFESKWSLRDGLSRTIEWWRNDTRV